MFEMKLLIPVVVCVLYCSQIVQGQQTQKRLVCYYDIVNPEKQSYSHNFKSYFTEALSNCTHLMYSYAQIEKFKINKSNLNPKPNDLKIQFPHLKIFLSVGGDKPELMPQYLQFLEAGRLKQKKFIYSVRKFLKQHYFDGLDLAFPFPRNKPRKVHSSFGAVYKRIKKIFTGNEVIDENAKIHKQQYTEFVTELNNVFVKENLKLSMTVLPNVNSTCYFDIFRIHKNFEFINLFAFDFITPDRNPEEADYTAPIYYKGGANRLPHYNIEYQVDHWINNGCPVNKLNLGIATYGQAWNLTTGSGLSGVPVVESTNGGGLLSLSEICRRLATKGVLREVIDVDRKYGNYVFRPADKNGKNGIWISFDDPEFAGIKTEYVKQRGMGGVALFDLQYDDYERFCKGPAFPILSRISQGLGILHQAYINSIDREPHTFRTYPIFAQYKKF